MTTRTRKIAVRLAIGALVVVLALAASTLVVSNRYATTQTAELSFTLPDDFAKVRAILVGSEATKQIIIRARDNDFLDEKWTALKPNANGLEMNAKLKVRSRDDYIGRPIVRLKQVVNIKSDEILSDIALEEPSERLWEFEISTHYHSKQGRKNHARRPAANAARGHDRALVRRIASPTTACWPRPSGSWSIRNAPFRN